MYDDALANWHTLNERVKKSVPVGVEPRPSRLPDKNFTTAPHRITMVTRQI